MTSRNDERKGKDTQFMRNSFVCCLVVCGCFLATASFDATRAQESKNKMGMGDVATSNAPRYVDEPDLKTLLPRFLTPQGFLDQNFAKATAKPSPYYTDFYGAQALADTTKERIKRDFVPKYAEVLGEDEHRLTLKFKSGWTGTFYPHSTLRVMGTEVPFDHVYVSGATWKEMLKNLDEFREHLMASKLETVYLIPNPHYKDELVVYKKMTGNDPPTKLVVDPKLTDMEQSSNAIVIYPEGAHGNVEAYNKFNAEVLTEHRFDWIGMEMLPASMQKDLDAFIQAGDGTPEYERARKVMIDYFTNSWNRTIPKTTGEENYYFKIVDLMRRKKTRVIGLEDVDIPYILFRYGENLFGAAVRSYNWAQAVPTSGRGLVYGGSGHFTSTQPINFQDFLQMRNPEVQLFTVAPLKMPASH